MKNKLEIKRIWWRSVQPGEFYNIERHPKRETGNGALYIEIPGKMVSETLNFLNVTETDFSSMPSLKIQASVIGEPQLSGPIEFGTKSGGRMRINNQNRQQPSSPRHPAWTASRNFPVAPDDVDNTEEARQYFPDGGLRIYIAESFDGKYYAGFTKGHRPLDMSANHPMFELYSNKSGGVINANKGWKMTDKLRNILSSWDKGRNVLLYGPPATGKTRLISELFQVLKTPSESNEGIILDPDDADTPFSRPELNLPIPKPVKVVWTTFHQSYGYEDFVLGLRPEMTESGTKLKPLAGVFLDAALELSDTTSVYNSVVIFIDEINRGNAARIFGEFMTFLDFDYREDGRVPLPLPLRQLKYIGGQSEKIYRAEGKEAEIPIGFSFPKHIYIVATMNSVDRAAVPIDSALARRFDRIEMRPNLSVLAHQWKLEENSIPKLDDNWENLSSFETAYLILDRLNLAIAADLGPEFELGHGLLTQLNTSPTSENDIWQDFAKAWDEVIYPQLEDRYSGRPEQLIDLLRADTPPLTGSYAWTLRTALSSNMSARTLTQVRISELNIEDIKRSFRWLTR